MAEAPLKLCFPPVVAPDTRLLILGSLPGAASLAAGRYYAHPRNQFWRLLEMVIDEELAALPYAARLEALLNCGVGLWDVVAAGRRQGSLDADIRLAAVSDIGELAATLPKLRAIAFNGGAASRIGRRVLGERPDLAFLDLPSSSPAYTLALETKAEAWRRLRPFIRL